MNVYAISDLHLSLNTDKPMDIFGPSWEGHFDIIKSDWQNKVGEDDIVLLGGDLSWAMRLEDAKADIDEIKKLNGKKVILRGNHDYWWSSLNKVRQVLDKDMFAIQNDAIKIQNVIICGSRGWIIPENKTSEEDIKIYERELIRLKMSLEKMKKIRTDNDIVIGMMHYPPFNNNKEVTEFTKLFMEYNVSKVIFGHLHAPARLDKISEIEGTKYFLTSCDLVKNKLVKIL